MILVQLVGIAFFFFWPVILYLLGFLFRTPELDKDQQEAVAFLSFVLAIVCSWWLLTHA